MVAAALHALREHLRGAFRQFVEREGTQTLERLVRYHTELLDALEASDGTRARTVHPSTRPTISTPSCSRLRRPDSPWTIPIES